jgi:hypothetical protein
MTEQDPSSELKALSREHMRLVWQIAQMGGEQLNDDDRRTAAAMAEHSEYAHLWDRLDRLSDAEITKDGTNPILHITMHAAVESQIAGGEPPETDRPRQRWSAAAFRITRWSIAWRRCWWVKSGM